jgi:hypothetical protein
MFDPVRTSKHDPLVLERLCAMSSKLGHVLHVLSRPYKCKGCSYMQHVRSCCSISTCIRFVTFYFIYFNIYSISFKNHQTPEVIHREYFEGLNKPVSECIMHHGDEVLHTTAPHTSHSSAVHCCLHTQTTILHLSTECLNTIHYPDSLALTMQLHKLHECAGTLTAGAHTTAHDTCCILYT